MAVVVPCVKCCNEHTHSLLANLCPPLWPNFAPHMENPHRVTEEIPSSTSTALALLLGMNGDEYIAYVVCPKCSFVYEYADCIVFQGGSRVQILQPYCIPKSSISKQAQECGMQLLKKVKSERSHKLVPINAFPHQPLINSFKRLARRKDFLDSCEAWRDRKSSVPHSFLGDICDGRVMA